MNCSLYTCHYCGTDKTCVKRFLRHLALQHEHLPSFSVSCHLCRIPYVKVESLRRHYYRKNSHILTERSKQNDPADSDTDNVEEGGADRAEVSCVRLEDTLKALQWHITLFVLKVQEKHLLSNVMQETLVSDLKLILEEFRQSFTEIVSNEIEQQEVNVPEGSDLHDLLHRPDLLATIFGTCNSTHSLHKYCQSVLHAIFPTAHELPVSIHNKTCVSVRFYSDNINSNHQHR